MKDMKITKARLKQIIKEEFEAEVESPHAEFHEEDEEAQDDVMRAEEERYGLPFTNRDIQLLLLRYVDKLVELENNGDHDTMAAVSDRVINYIDNLILKVDNGTAAYPAYSNKISKKLSMFYYQTPDIGEEFKKWVVKVSQSNRPIISWVMGLAGETGDRDAFEDEYFTKPSDIRRMLEEIPGYELIKAAKSKPGGHPRDHGGAQSYWEWFRNMTPVPHLETLKQRMDGSKVTIAKLRDRIESEEMGTDYSNEKILDMFEDARDLWHAADSKIGSIVRYNPVQSLVKDFAESFETKFAEAETQILENDFKKVHRAVNSIIRELRRVMVGIPSALDPARYPRGASAVQLVGMMDQLPYGKDLMELETQLREISEVLKGQKYASPKQVKMLIRDIRKAVEGFQTMFESKSRNALKMTKAKLKQIIKEELEVTLTNEEATEMFGEDVREQLEEKPLDEGLEALAADLDPQRVAMMVEALLQIGYNFAAPMLAAFLARIGYEAGATIWQGPLKRKDKNWLVNFIYDEVTGYKDHKGPAPKGPKGPPPGTVIPMGKDINRDNLD